MNSNNNLIPEHQDFETNKAKAMDVMKEWSGKFPPGMKMFMSSHGVGYSYTHPKDAPGHKTSEIIGFNQGHNAFCEAANDSINFYINMAKRMNKRYGSKPSITDSFLAYD